MYIVKFKRGVGVGGENEKGRNVEHFKKHRHIANDHWQEIRKQITCSRPIKGDENIVKFKYY